MKIKSARQFGFFAGLATFIILTGLILIGNTIGIAAEPDNSGNETKKAVRELRISAVGDLMIDASARDTVKEEGYDFPFFETKQYFKKSHIVFANLEGPLTAGGKADKKKKFIFRSPPDKVARALKNTGINIVSLANNHSLDYGAEGLADTIFILDKFDIKHVGAGKNSKAARSAEVIEVNGYSVAFLGYNLTFPDYAWAKRRRAGTAFGHKKHIRADVKAAKKHADIVVVSFHWGREVKTKLRPYQKKLAHAAIDSGAQLILGHHPHVLQGIEVYKEGLILYSLGNYAFGSFSKRTTRSAVAQISFRENKVHKLEMIPLNVDNTKVFFQPVALEKKDADKVVKTLQRLSKPFGVKLANNKGVAELLMTKPGQKLANRVEKNIKRKQ